MMEKVYSRPASLRADTFRYCPGCSHGVATKLICQVLDEMGVAERTAAILPVGCSTMGNKYFDTDVVVAAHGRAPAVATGYKRCAPERMVFTYQGDGDLASIGMAEIMHCANRGENIVVVFINNGIYGMTGGQMAPTTLLGQKSTTTPGGRNAKREGFPLKMSEIINQMEAPAYVARFSLDSPANILKAKKGLSQAFHIEEEGGGFSFVELLAICPTNWGLSPVKSLEWLVQNMAATYPTGVFRSPKGE